jgi:hypothetical protein
VESNVLPYSPFPGARFNNTTTVLNLEKDYLASERLQTTSAAFEVPLESGLLGTV